MGNKPSMGKRVLVVLVLIVASILLVKNVSASGPGPTHPGSSSHSLPPESPTAAAAKHQEPIKHDDPHFYQKCLSLHVALHSGSHNAKDLRRTRSDGSQPINTDPLEPFELKGHTHTTTQPAATGIPNSPATGHPHAHATIATIVPPQPSSSPHSEATAAAKHQEPTKHDDPHFYQEYLPSHVTPHRSVSHNAKYLRHTRSDGSQPIKPISGSHKELRHTRSDGSQPINKGPLEPFEFKGHTHTITKPAATGIPNSPTTGHPHATIATTTPPHPSSPPHSEALIFCLDSASTKPAHEPRSPSHSTRRSSSTSSTTSTAPLLKSTATPSTPASEKEKCQKGLGNRIMCLYHRVVRKTRHYVGRAGDIIKKASKFHAVIEKLVGKKTTSPHTPSPHPPSTTHTPSPHSTKGYARLNNA